MNKGFIWAGLELIGRQGISFIVQIVLARILIPSDFGLVGMLAIFIGISNVIIDSGFQVWLLQEKKPTNVEFSTVFFFNLFAAGMLYIILFSIAPFVAVFYQKEILSSMLRVLSLTIVFSAFSLIHRTKLSIQLNFKTQTIISTISMIISGSIAIVLAYMGFGVWSLVLQQVFNQMLLSIFFIAFNRWWPSLTFDWQVFRKMFHYSWKLLVSGLMDTAYLNGTSVLVGRFFPAATLGFYTNAQKMSDVVAQSVSGAVQKVSFPALSKVKEDKNKLKIRFQSTLKLTVFFTVPVMFGLSSCGYELFNILFGEKWLPAIPYFQLLCIAGSFFPLHVLNLNILQIVGRTDRFLILEIIKKVIAISFLLVSLVIFRSVLALVWATLIVDFLLIYANGFYTKEILNYSVWDQLKDIATTLVAGLTMWGIIYFSTQFLAAGTLSTLLIKIAIGSISFVVISYILKNSELFKATKLINKVFIHK
ncbi:lipopolysaccharide biosynthesis protein [Enterococcus pseudoavium]|uniref:lipopolysaccharide biosynthesis protein n=1 Tax=Enterococcus pseudoavium TaxID=44007 RepID=UPI00082D9220|nr:lipopolysaccharide biosynthesis protein [Enterococcus pseudoavium]